MIREVIHEALQRPLQTLAEALVLVITVGSLLAATVVLWAILR